MSEKLVKFYLDRPGVSEVILLNKRKTGELEYRHMSKLLSEIQASFLQTFGFQGGFELKYKPTQFRTAYRISASDARTSATLKRNPGWLAQFTKEKL